MPHHAVRLNRLRTVWGGMLLAFLAVSGSLRAGDPQRLPFERALYLRSRSLEPVRILGDALGPGERGVRLPSAGDSTVQLRWTLEEIPEGDYFLELPVVSGDYLGFTENLPSRVRLYREDTPLGWMGHTFPVKLPPGSAQPYGASLVVRHPVRIRSGERLRIVGGDAVVGEPRLHRIHPGVDVEFPRPFVQVPGKGETPWLEIGWESTERDGRNVTQTFWLFNPGARERAVRLKAEVRDFWMTPLLDIDETIVLQPLERVVRSYAFQTGRGGRTRLSLEASAADASPSHFLSKFFVEDIQEGPRPRACLNGEWEMVYVPGVEPGPVPPEAADWEPCMVPGLQENQRGHCMWFRRDFQSPPFLVGDRFVFRFGQVMSESWLYVNDRLVHHQFDGAEPFEADATDAWIPGQVNRIHLAVRDWLAYSPVNRERVLRGEAPVFKDGMISPAGYFAMGSWGGAMGMGQPVYVEARPAVSVDDVAISTTIRDRRLRLDYRLVNRSAEKAEVVLAPVLLEAGRERHRLETRKLAIEAGGTVETTLEVPWPRGVALWRPGAPHLYLLSTSVTGAGAEDRHIERFGFRDIRIDGIHFVVNGAPMKMRSSWTSVASGVGMVLRGPPEPAGRFERIWDRQMLAMRNWDIQISRTHNNSGIRDALEIADETGLMIKPENGNFVQQRFTFEEEFWRNARTSQLRMVEAYRNHASVFMWSAGNENMWGWIYQGQKVRDFANRWQVKLAQAMRDADPQARPIEWEADGDLLGQWEYHQLHYPRELAGNPALPVSAWWGPLDGKTVAPYSMGPIVLGQKPITVGEAFWSSMLVLPHGASILLGDGAYQGSPFLHHAWMESSQFFLNGFRDVEFGLIDTYSPLWLVRPQAIVLKDETSSFYGGRTVMRPVNVHHDQFDPARLLLRWSLQAEKGGRVLDSGRQRLRMAPAELKRLEIGVRLPRVSEPLAARFEMTLLDDGGRRVLHRVERTWHVHPSPSLRMPPDLSIHLYDPEGETAGMLESLGVPFTRLDELQVPDDAGAALVLGKGAVRQGAQRAWRLPLLSFVREGGKLLVMEQTVSPEFLPFPAPLVSSSLGTTMAFRRAASHPLLRGIDDSRLRWWAGDHRVSRSNYRKPVGGNVLPLVDVGTLDGLLESPLMEQFLGRGSILLCQLLLSEKAGTEPVAGALLQNLLDYLAEPLPIRSFGNTLLMAGSNEALRTALEQSRLQFDLHTPGSSSLNLEAYRLAVVDAATALSEDLVSELRGFAEAGGTVLLHRAGPAQRDRLTSLLGVDLSFLEVAGEASRDVRYKVLKRGQNELLDGISNHEFFWPPRRVLGELRQRGVTASGADLRPGESLADYFCFPKDPEGTAVQLTYPCALLAVPAGRGLLVLNQLRLEDPIEDAVQPAARLRSLLLTNLGGILGGRDPTVRSREERIARYSFIPVSLEPYANRGLRDHPDLGIIGWTNQGEGDMREMPVGESVFAGVPFVIPEPKSVIVLSSVAGRNEDLPPEVTGIAVGRKADALFFLHGVAWGGRPVPFLYRVHYADGTSVEVPIRQGRQIMDWWGDPMRHAEGFEAGNTVVGFTGSNPLRAAVHAYLYEWINPKPDVEITSVDFTRADDSRAAVPVMVGLTVAVRQAEEGVVTGVIGLHGVTVRLGDRTEEVHYIGIDPLEEQHPFHAEALEAHKALVMGRQVRIQEDTLPRDAQGRQLAYVLLGDDEAESLDMVNARLIGEGLAPIGSFQDNNRHRTYLENLAFIAGQGRKGIHGVETPR